MALVALKALGQKIADERPQWLGWFPVVMGGAIGIYFALPVEPSGWIIGIVTVIILSLAVISCYFSLANLKLPHHKNNRAEGWMFSALMLVALACGWSAITWRADRVQAPVIAQGFFTVTGTVYHLESLGDKGQRITLEDLSLENIKATDTPRLVRVTLRGRLVSKASIGDRVRMRAALFPPFRPSLPGGYDFSRDAWFKQIGGVGYALSSLTLVRPAIKTSSRQRIEDMRRQIADDIRDHLDGDIGAVAAALLVGERGAISKDSMHAIRSAGLAHLLAISGLHMGIIAGLFFAFFRGLCALSTRLTLTYPIKKWAAVVALIGAFGYFQITGMTVPTQRAFMMTVLVLLAVLIDRRAISMRLVAWAAVIILIMTPEVLVGPSFQMSFAAVIALVSGCEAFQSFKPYLYRQRDQNRPLWIKAVNRLMLYGGGVLLTTLIATWATMPFAAYHFHRYAVYGFLANIIAIPLTAFWIMPLGLLALLAWPFIDVSWVLAAMGQGIAVLLSLARAIEHLPGHVFIFSAMPMVALVGVTLGGLWFLLWRQRWRWWGWVAVGLGILLWIFNPLPNLLIAGKGRLVGLYGVGDQEEKELFVSTKISGRRWRNDWQEHLGMSEVQSWDRLDMACDHFGCLLELGRLRVGLADSQAMIVDCARTDVFIAFFPIRTYCRQPDIVIDRFDLWRNGGYILRFDSRGIRAMNVRQWQGERPWTLRPEDGTSTR